MVVKCEKEIDVKALIADLDAKSRKKAIDDKNSYVVAVNRELLSVARDVIKHYYEQEQEVTNGAE